jgi:hypothetical protein
MSRSYNCPQAKGSKVGLLPPIVPHMGEFDCLMAISRLVPVRDVSRNDVGGADRGPLSLFPLSLGLSLVPSVPDVAAGALVKRECRVGPR